MSARRPTAFASTALAIALLAGCAPSPSYDAAAAELLQQQVLAVSTSSAEQDWEAARTRLLELEASANVALARGEISQQRFDAIIAALALVRADLDAAIAAAEKAAAEAAAAEAAAEEAARQQAAAKEAARQQAARDAAGEDDDDDDSGGGNGNSKNNRKNSKDD
jgi:hypothetical protein